MTAINLRYATLDDVGVLAEMNEQLILDEGSLNRMARPALEARMRDWLENDREAIIVERDDKVIGYLVYRTYKEEYFPYQNSVYVRQFFIQPSFRRRGIGQTVFERIAAEFFPDDHSVMLDVLESNPEGKAFWLKLGFALYHTTLRRNSVTG